MLVLVVEATLLDNLPETRKLWRDVFESYLRMYYVVLYLMEDNDILDSENDLHLLALHYFFLPRLQRSLEAFRNAWNVHNLSSAQHSSPLQL